MTPRGPFQPLPFCESGMRREKRWVSTLGSVPKASKVRLDGGEKVRGRTVLNRMT